MKIFLRSAACALVLGALASAQTLTGSVTNGTTNKPAAGDDVILIKLAQGMEEASRTKSDAKGRFTLTLDDTAAPHLVRVVHQNVTYHRMAPPGSTSVEVQVYDSAKKIAGVSVTADVMRFQAQGNELQGVRLFAVDNKSNPPRTQMSDQSFEFYLPDGATVDSGEAQTEGGQPLNLAPVPQNEKNRYAFLFPLRPGQTQFQVVFHLPYGGELSIDPKPLYGAQHFVVMMPKSMQFAAAPGSQFQNMQNPKDPGNTVEVASNTQVGQMLAFRISGTGTISEPAAGGQEGDGQAGGDSRPGGGLGPPIDAPHPMQKFMWFILAGFAVILTAGAIFAARRPQPAGAEVSSSPAAAVAATAKKPASRSGLLLEALKEELFQLEVEHKQGSLSDEEYQKAKAALDQTLERAVKRDLQKA